MSEVQTPVFHPEQVRQDFPIFQKFPGFSYLDNAATTQKPQVVIDRIADFYAFENANIHRGIYDLSHQATEAYEKARKTIADFVNAEGSDCIAFTKGTTESINIVAQSWLKPQLAPGKNVVISLMEHHANLIPWQQVCRATGAELRVIPLTREGFMDYDQTANLIDPNTCLVAITHLSNTLGVMTDVERIKVLTAQFDTPLLLDAAQSAALHELDVQTLGCDFLTFSGHKMYGPMGVGILYARKNQHRSIQTFNVGGGIIRNVTLEDTMFQRYPILLEAGTPNVPGALGLEAAIQYIQGLDRTSVRQYMAALSATAIQALRDIPGMQLLSPEPAEHGIISFIMSEVHPHDIASFLNSHHVAVRAGMHCTQPLLEFLGQPATVRASFTVYNTSDDIDQLSAALRATADFWKA